MFADQTFPLFDDLGKRVSNKPSNMFPTLTPS